MTYRIRHCVECPKCLTRYIVGFSPYSNRSYLAPIAPYPWEEYMLYCSCATPSVQSRWRWSDVKTFEISKAAHHRGYGTQDEVVPVFRPAHKTWPFDPLRGRYLKAMGLKSQNDLEFQNEEERSR